MHTADWRSKALCEPLSNEEADKIFNIGPGQSANRARIFCATCPVKKECLNFAITYDEIGIWAGTTDAERSMIPAFIKEELRERGAADGTLESRNINDFIPLVRQPVQTPELDAEPPVELLVVLARQFEGTSDLQAFA